MPFEKRTFDIFSKELRTQQKQKNTVFIKNYLTAL